MKGKTCTISIIFLLASLNSRAQLTLLEGASPSELANTLAGSNVSIIQSRISGSPLQYRRFSFSNSAFPISAGIILSTGSVFDCTGLNKKEDTGTDFHRPGNDSLTALSGWPTRDAVVFEIEFKVESDKIEFNYVFASEEYNEYVGSTYNDVFAFYISGPGILGYENLAMLPDTNLPVTVNNINLKSFRKYYRNNEYKSVEFEFDGYTTLLSAKKTGLVPSSIYKLTMVIADANDGLYDAAVFLAANSLVQGDVSIATTKIGTEPIYFEFNSSVISPEQQSKLDSLVKIMMINPLWQLELYAYTDCRGTERYNQNLSEKRARVTYDYLINHGVPASRVKYKGMGMAGMVSVCDCEEGKQNSCTDEQRRLNRRAECVLKK